MTTTLDRPAPAPASAAEIRSMWEQLFLYAFIIAPFLATIAGIWYAASGTGIGWVAVGLSVLFFMIAGHGVTVGFHRYLTHGSFKAKRPLRIALAIAGSLSVEGPVIRWVADHRKHHAFSDREGDPHSPWRFGTRPGRRARPQALPAVDRAHPAAARLPRLGADRLYLARCVDDVPLGRACAGVRPPPHHLVGELDLPCVRQQAVRHP